jgi:hypothetical protein
MTTRKRFEKVITDKCNKPNIKGYFLNNSENLIDGIDLDLFQSDLMQGSGNELKSKFNAIYSSSALAVNNFAIVKKLLKDFKFLNYSDFNNAQFERQFKTGLGGTPPNLDFTIENNETIIAFESKFLEPLDKKYAKFTESYKKENLNYLDDFWFSLINKYHNVSTYLDVAQLIKHSIGLINHKRLFPHIKKLILVYIYWTPDNFVEFAEYKQHQKELTVFEKDIENSNDLEFISLTYYQFWNLYDKSIFKEHFDKMKNRYKIEI